jgi:hypothetical protein
MGEKNLKLLERMTEVRKAITNYKMSSFMQEMKGFAPVRPPIMMTNIIQKNVDFNKCYKLWIMLDRVDRIGYHADILDRDVSYEDEYQDQVKNALMILYATVANSQIEDFDFSKPLNYLRDKKVKVVERIKHDEYLKAGEYLLEDHTLNQYFLDRIRDVNNERFTTLTDAGISEEESISIVYKRLQEIVDESFRDFLEQNFRPEEIEDVEERIEVQNKVMEYYRDIEKIKQENNNQEKERQKQKELEEEERQRRLAELDEEKRIKLLKQEKLEEAKRILKEAKKKREKEKQKK